jgi:hypothetical protein
MPLPSSGNKHNTVSHLASEPKRVMLKYAGVKTSDILG